MGLLNLYLLHTVIWNWNYEYCILCSKYHPSILCAYSFFPQDNALLVQLKHFCRSGMKLTALVNNVTCYIFITCRNLATAFLVHKHPVVTCVWLGKIIISHSITSSNFLRGVQNDTCKQFTSLIWLLVSKRLRHESLWQNRLVFSLYACETKEVQSKTMFLSRGHSALIPWMKLLKIMCVRRYTFARICVLLKWINTYISTHKQFFLSLYFC